MNVKNVAGIVAELGMLKYFPADDKARAAIVKLVCNMATTEDQVRWLVNRTVALFGEWPGPKELRAVFCSKFPPRDGIDAHSLIFESIDGIPSENPRQLAIGGPSRLALPPGHESTVDPELELQIQRAAVARQMPLARPVKDRFSRQLAEALTAPRDRPEIQAPSPLPANAITQADVDAEVTRQRRAAGER